MPRLRWLSLSLAPPLAASLSMAAGERIAGRTAGQTAALLAVLALVNAGMFAAAVLAWAFALVRGHTIDNLLRPSERRDRAVSPEAALSAVAREALARACQIAACPPGCGSTLTSWNSCSPRPGSPACRRRM